jgi:hypothetical protein
MEQRGESVPREVSMRPFIVTIYLKVGPPPVPRLCEPAGMRAFLPRTTSWVVAGVTATLSISLLGILHSGETAKSEWYLVLPCIATGLATAWAVVGGCLGPRTETSTPAHAHPTPRAVPEPDAPAPAPLPEPPAQRVFADIEPKTVQGYYLENTTTRANAMAQHLWGKWLRFEGVVQDVQQDSALLEVPSNIACYMLRCHGHGEGWEARLSLLEKGARVCIVGRIESATAMFLNLAECEFVSDDLPSDNGDQ